MSRPLKIGSDDADYKQELCVRASYGYICKVKVVLW